MESSAPGGALDSAVWGGSSLLEFRDAELARGVFQHLLNPELGFAQALARGAQPRHALFEQRERLVEVGLVRFQPADDFLETLQVGGERVGGHSAYLRIRIPTSCATAASVVC